MRHLFLLFVFVGSCMAFVCRKPSSLKLFAGQKVVWRRSQREWKTHDPAAIPVRAHAISIDHTVLPPLVQPIQSMCGVSVVAAVLMYNLYQSSIRTATVQDLSSCKEKNLNIAQSLKESMPQFFARHLSKLPKYLKSHVDDDVLNLEQWNVCKLAQVEEISKEYDRYRFQVPSHGDSKISLDIAQELLLCSVDAKGRTLKEGFFLASPPQAHGYFDIVCKSSRQVPNEMSDLPFALQFLQEGDELAVKGGAKRLVLPRGATSSSIAALSVLTSGLGILPTLQLLREVLSDERASSVQLVEVVWINDSKKDFLLNAELEALEMLHGHGEGASGRLQVTRVVDREAGNANTQFSEQLRGAVSAFETGSVAVVLAQDEAVALKARQLFSSLGYPNDCIASLTQTKTL